MSVPGPKDIWMPPAADRAKMRILGFLEELDDEKGMACYLVHPGDCCSFGFDPIPMVLPNSGLVIRFPAEMGLNPDGTVNEEVKTAPDVYAEQTREDMLKMIQRQDAGYNFFDRMEYDTILRKAFELAGFSR